MNENAEAATGSASEVTTTTADIGGGTAKEPSAEAREETAQAVADPQAAEANPAANAPAAEADRRGAELPTEMGGKAAEAETKPADGGGTSAQTGEEDLKSRVAELTAQLITGKAEAAAAMLGVPEGKIKHVVKLANLEGIDTTKEDAAQKIREAVAQVLADLPELAQTQTVTPNGTGSPGAFARKVVPEKSPFARGFEQG